MSKQPHEREDEAEPGDPNLEDVESGDEDQETEDKVVDLFDDVVEEEEIDLDDLEAMEGPDA
jgi:hypothetical protein